jgi:hypothetical protein
MRQESGPSSPDAASTTSGGYDKFGQERAGRHRQQSGPKDTAADPPDLRAGSSPAPILPVQREQPGPYRQERPQDPYKPQGWPPQDPYKPQGWPSQQQRKRNTRNALIGLSGALIGLSALIGIIVAISLATTHNSPSAGNAAATSTGSGELTWTCAMDYGKVTLVFTDHTGSDIEVYSFDILYYGQSGIETGSDTGIGGFTVPAGQEYIDHEYAIHDGGGTTCTAAAVEAGPPP